jgi:hypothetical protein
VGTKPFVVCVRYIELRVKQDASVRELGDGGGKTLELFGTEVSWAQNSRAATPLGE